MRFLGLPFLRAIGGATPLIVRVIVGVIMAWHGWQKLDGGPANFGNGLLDGLGIPFPVFMGWVVTLLELVGGVMLVIGLLSRLVALLLTINLAVAIALVKVDVGLIAPQGGGVGAELDLALIAGFLVVLLLGPGRPSVDHVLGIEETVPTLVDPSRPARA